MEVSSRIILRRSIHSFLQNYHYFTSTAAFLAFPFSAAILISQASVPTTPSSLFSQIYNRLRIVFDAAGFPSSQLFNILNLKVSQTITCSIFTFPFTLTYLLIAKASTIQALKQNKRTPLPLSFSSIATLYKSLLNTYICNCFLILSANATAFCLMFLAFSCIEELGYSSQNAILLMSVVGGVFFSVILANALVISNMALALSGMEGHGGYLAILKACVMIRERTSMALFLALPVNMVLAAIEALFQFRVVKAYLVAGNKANPSLALEGIFIAYLYSIFVILDTIVCCMFYKSFKTEEESWRIDQQDKHLLRSIEFAMEDNDGYKVNKNFVEMP